MVLVFLVLRGEGQIAFNLVLTVRQRRLPTHKYPIGIGVRGRLNYAGFVPRGAGQDVVKLGLCALGKAAVIAGQEGDGVLVFLVIRDGVVVLVFLVLRGEDQIRFDPFGEGFVPAVVFGRDKVAVIGCDHRYGDPVLFEHDLPQRFGHDTVNHDVPALTVDGTVLARFEGNGHFFVIVVTVAVVILYIGDRDFGVFINTAQGGILYPFRVGDVMVTILVDGHHIRDIVQLDLVTGLERSVDRNVLAFIERVLCVTIEGRHEGDRPLFLFKGNNVGEAVVGLGQLDLSAGGINLLIGHGRPNALCMIASVRLCAKCLFDIRSAQLANAIFAEFATLIEVYTNLEVRFAIGEGTVLRLKVDPNLAIIIDAVIVVILDGLIVHINDLVRIPFAGILSVRRIKHVGANLIFQFPQYMVIILARQNGAVRQIEHDVSFFIAYDADAGAPLIRALMLVTDFPALVGNRVVAVLFTTFFPLKEVNCQFPRLEALAHVLCVVVGVAGDDGSVVYLLGASFINVPAVELPALTGVRFFLRNIGCATAHRHILLGVDHQALFRHEGIAAGVPNEVVHARSRRVVFSEQLRNTVNVPGAGTCANACARSAHGIDDAVPVNRVGVFIVFLVRCFRIKRVSLAVHPNLREGACIGQVEQTIANRETLVSTLPSAVGSRSRNVNDGLARVREVGVVVLCGVTARLEDVEVRGGFTVHIVLEQAGDRNGCRIVDGHDIVAVGGNGQLGGLAFAQVVALNSGSVDGDLLTDLSGTGHTLGHFVVGAFLDKEDGVTGNSGGVVQRYGVFTLGAQHQFNGLFVAQGIAVDLDRLDLDGRAFQIFTDSLRVQDGFGVLLQILNGVAHDCGGRGRLGRSGRDRGRSRDRSRSRDRGCGHLRHSSGFRARLHSRGGVHSSSRFSGFSRLRSSRRLGGCGRVRRSGSLRGLGRGLGGFLGRYLRRLLGRGFGRLGRSDRNFGRYDRRLGRVGRNFGRLNRRLSRVGRNFGRLNRRLGRVSRGFGRIDRRLDRLLDLGSGIQLFINRKGVDGNR